MNKWKSTGNDGQTTIPYFFDGTHNNEEKNIVRSAVKELDMWVDCLNFIEVRSNDHRFSNKIKGLFLKFIRSYFFYIFSKAIKKYKAHLKMM